MDPKFKRKGRAKLTEDGTIRVNLYGIDAKLWNRLRVHALVHKVPAGAIINWMLRQYLDDCEKESV